MSSPVIEVENLGKSYPMGWGRTPVRALEDVSLKVGPGEVFGLLGPNGAGKTSLIKVLLGITRPNGGQATMLGNRIGHVGTRAQVGYLPEGHRYPLHLTGAGVVHWFARLSGTPTRGLEDRVRQLLEAVGIERWGHVRLRKYSKGMVQRLGLATALVHRPRLLILDEPTDGVDPVGRQTIRNVLLEEKKRGTTIFVNSHLLSEVERTCDRVAILSHGKLLREGTVPDLTDRGLVYRVSAASIRESVLERIRERADGVESSEGQVKLRVGSLEVLNACLDDLRASGALLQEVVPEKSTLEESFLEILKGEETHP